MKVVIGPLLIRVSVPDQPVAVDVVRSRVITILTNLLDNAVKYSPDQPQVQCSTSVDATAGVVTVAVAESAPRRRSRFTVTLPLAADVVPP